MADLPPIRFEPSEVPVILSDGVANIHRSPGLVRFYLLRYDPVPDGSGNWTNAMASTVCGQVAMSTTGFAAMALFFQQQLAMMVASGEVDSSVVESMRKAIAEINKAQAPGA